MKQIVLPDELKDMSRYEERQLLRALGWRGSKAKRPGKFRRFRMYMAPQRVKDYRGQLKVT